MRNSSPLLISSGSEPGRHTAQRPDGCNCRTPCSATTSASPPKLYQGSTFLCSCVWDEAPKASSVLRLRESSAKERPRCHGGSECTPRPRTSENNPFTPKLRL